MSLYHWNRGLDDAVIGEQPRSGQPTDYYEAYQQAASFVCPWPDYGPPEPTIEDYCAGYGHDYYGDDEDGGRCYCGAVRYQRGGDGE